MVAPVAVQSQPLINTTSNSCWQKNNPKNNYWNLDKRPEMEQNIRYGELPGYTMPTAWVGIGAVIVQTNTKDSFGPNCPG